MIKVCEYCGSEFEGFGNARYCSEECKALGAREKLNTWRTNTDYNARKREQRQKLTEGAHGSGRSDRQKAQRLEAEARALKSQEEFAERIENNEPLAMMIYEARHNPHSWDYWHYYKEYMLDRDEGSKCEVNNISIHDKEFEDKVLMTITEYGAIIVRG